MLLSDLLCAALIYMATNTERRIGVPVMGADGVVRSISMPAYPSGAELAIRALFSGCVLGWWVFHR